MHPHHQIKNLEMAGDHQTLPGPTMKSRSEDGPAQSLTPTGQQEAGATGLEPATSGVTGRRSNQLSYAPVGEDQYGKPAGVTPARRNFDRALGFERSQLVRFGATPNPAVSVGPMGSAMGTQESGSPS
jgi:hypothetical protein